ncbi:MAG: hypothetical protein ACYS5V_07045 [Planctomycetota bacterium]
MTYVKRFPDNESKVQWLMDRTRADGGLAPVDLERFWADQEIARADPFGADIPQVALGVMMAGECVFDELGVAEDAWRYANDAAWRRGLNREYNIKAEKIVGRRVLREEPAGASPGYQGIGGLHDVFEARQVFITGSWWLLPSAHDEENLTALLNRVEVADVRNIILPDDWDDQKARLEPLGIKPRLYRSQRGPVTFAMSVYGVVGLIFLILGNLGLAGRFRDAILKTMLEIARVLDEEAGYSPETAPHGFGFADDNCALLTPEMYEFFGYPILKGMWDRYSPDPHDRRGQHSDSAMGHLLGILGRLDLTDTNFGPTVMCDEIRRHLPRAVIHGELAPFTFSRDEQENIVLEFLRDHDMTRESRGLCFATAGSINNGSRLTGMRLIMSAIQHFGRFDG